MLKNILFLFDVCAHNRIFSSDLDVFPNFGEKNSIIYIYKENTNIGKLQTLGHCNTFINLFFFVMLEDL